MFARCVFQGSNTHQSVLSLRDNAPVQRCASCPYCKGPYGEMLLHADDVSNICVATGGGVPQQLGDMEKLGKIQASLENLTCSKCGSHLGYRNVDRENLGRVIINSQGVLEQVRRNNRVPPGPVNYLLTVNQGVTFISQKPLLKKK